MLRTFVSPDSFCIAGIRSFRIHANRRQSTGGNPKLQQITAISQVWDPLPEAQAVAMEEIALAPADVRGIDTLHLVCSPVRLLFCIFLIALQDCRWPTYVCLRAYSGRCFRDTSTVTQAEQRCSDDRSPRDMLCGALGLRGTECHVLVWSFAVDLLMP